jgi:hypothetical protein
LRGWRGPSHAGGEKQAQTEKDYAAHGTTRLIGQAAIAKPSEQPRMLAEPYDNQRA